MTTTRPSTTLSEGQLTVDGVPLFAGIPPTCVLDPRGATRGVFLRTSTALPTSRYLVGLGTAIDLVRFTCTHRYEPFWMKPMAGSDLARLPIETQWLMFERSDGRVVLVVPLIDPPLRASLMGKDGGMVVVVESGDPRVIAGEALALYIAVGTDPYALIEDAAAIVCGRLGTGRLRRDKPVPRCADLFGWCTWDAFYQEVSHEKVRQGLASFAAVGLAPRLLILDDGWQSERVMPTGERRLTSFRPNAKFAGDLTPTVRMAKHEFAVDTVLVWHAVHGYWGGVDGASLPGFEVQDLQRSYSPGILSYNASYNLDWWGAMVGMVPPSAIHRFYHDYHRQLREQGVDGVKVDNQASIEGLGHGHGGRVRLMQVYREALEASVALHFSGNLINCMSCSNEMFYLASGSTLTRTSTDFWPNLPASHGAHLYTNAQVGMWFGEFCHPDWDMFQSGHPMGAFHAAGRAVSGAPVYVSDKPDAHDAVLLKKLIFSDGTVARASDPGRPTRDCLFRDPTGEDVLLKIFNRNPGGGVVAAFNARFDPQATIPPVITGDIAPDDVPGLDGEEFAIFAHHRRSLLLARRGERLPIQLAELTAEVFTIAPITDGVAAIGLADKLNSGGAITRCGWSGRQYQVELRDGGELVLWCRSLPRQVSVDGRDVAFSQWTEHGISVTVPGVGAQSVTLGF